MRILLTSSAVEIGGSEVYLQELAGRLLDGGHDVTVFIPAPLNSAFLGTDCGAICLVEGLEWAYSGEDSAGGKSYLAKVERQAQAFKVGLSKHGPFDLTFVNANWPTHYAGVLQVLARTTARFVVHFHLCPHTVWLNRQAREIHAAALARAEGLSTISRTAKLFLEQTFGRMLQIQVIENGSRLLPARVRSRS